MAERQSLGPIQVTDLNLVSINDALRQLQERIDEAKGLGGDTTIHAGLTAGDITGDAVNVDSVRIKDTNGTLLHSLGVAT